MLMTDDQKKSYDMLKGKLDSIMETARADRERFGLFNKVVWENIETSYKAGLDFLDRAVVNNAEFDKVNVKQLADSFSEVYRILTRNVDAIRLDLVKVHLDLYKAFRGGIAGQQPSA